MATTAIGAPARFAEQVTPPTTVANTASIHIQPNSLVVVDIHSRQLLDSVMYQYFDVQTVKI